MSSIDIKQELSKIYYESTDIWGGQKAIKELLAKTNKKISTKKIIQWLSHQLLWLRHLPSPKTY